jgi:tetratricopeptide (TPR) repeat protein
MTAENAEPVRPVFRTRRAAALVPVLLAAVLLSACGRLPLVTVIGDPLDREEHLLLGRAYEKDGEAELADREYRAALPLPEACLALGNLRFAEGRTAEAERMYLRALAADALPQAANNLAWLYHSDSRKPEEALRLARLAVKEGEARAVPEAEMENFLDTLKKIEAAAEEGRNKPKGFLR